MKFANYIFILFNFTLFLKFKEQGWRAPFETIGLTAGSYSYSVRDGDTCESSSSFTIHSYPGIYCYYYKLFVLFLC